MTTEFEGDFEQVFVYLRFPPGRIEAWLDEALDLSRVDVEFEGVFATDDGPEQSVRACLADYGEAIAVAGDEVVTRRYGGVSAGEAMPLLAACLQAVEHDADGLFAAHSIADAEHLEGEYDFVFTVAGTDSAQGWPNEHKPLPRPVTPLAEIVSSVERHGGDAGGAEKLLTSLGYDLRVASKKPRAKAKKAPAKQAAPETARVAHGTRPFLFYGARALEREERYHDYYVRFASALPSDGVKAFQRAFKKALCASRVAAADPFFAWKKDHVYIQVVDVFNWPDRRGKSPSFLFERLVDDVCAAFLAAHAAVPIAEIRTRAFEPAGPLDDWTRDSLAQQPKPTPLPRGLVPKDEGNPEKDFPKQYADKAKATELRELSLRDPAAAEARAIEIERELIAKRDFFFTEAHHAATAILSRSTRDEAVQIMLDALEQENGGDRGGIEGLTASVHPRATEMLIARTSTWLELSTFEAGQGRWKAMTALGRRRDAAAVPLLLRSAARTAPGGAENGPMATDALVALAHIGAPAAQRAVAEAFRRMLGWADPRTHEEALKELRSAIAANLPHADVYDLLAAEIAPEVLAHHRDAANAISATFYALRQAGRPLDPRWFARSKALLVEGLDRFGSIAKALATQRTPGAAEVIIELISAGVLVPSPELIVAVSASATPAARAIVDAQRKSDSVRMLSAVAQALAAFDDAEAKAGARAALLRAAELAADRYDVAAIALPSPLDPSLLEDLFAVAVNKRKMPAKGAKARQERDDAVERLLRRLHDEHPDEG